jgi:hypothetical protein
MKNSFLKNLYEFQQRVERNVSVSEFIEILKTSSRTHKMNIIWQTEGSADGSGKPPHQSQHLMWWDSGAYVGGKAGGSATKALQDQFNLKTTGGEWRTLSYNNIKYASFKGVVYRVS